jgi:glyoxylase I family protein
MSSTPKAPAEAPFTLAALDHVVLRVRDLDAALAFYVGVLGCEVVRRRENLGLYHLSAGTSMIDLVPVDGELGARGGAPAGPEGRNMDHFCLRILPFDADAVLAHLRAHGLEADGPGDRFGAEGTGPSIYVTDPDGNVVELKGPAH